MTRKNLKIDEVLRSLSKKKDVRIFGNSIRLLSNRIYDAKLKKIITNPNKSFDLGNGSYGKIDFLVNYCGYNKFTVDKFK